jgi:phage shock protein E
MFGLFEKRGSSMTMKEAQAELARDKSIVLIDVRNIDEYKQGHIKGSINVPLNLVPVSMTQKVPDKRARIFVYCLSGARSSQASNWMTQNGYENVTNIGGITSWIGPTERG